MAILPILKYPNSRLREKAKTVEVFDERIKDIVSNMVDTMMDAKGIGLAATQVDIHLRIVVIDISEDYSSPTIFINPEMKITDETPKSYTEGCLSIPGIQEPVERPTEVLVNAFDQEGNSFEQKYTGLMATCIQHEIDHLNGKLFIDYLSPLKRQLIRKQIKKNKSK
ncbi:MAG: peptide deformylase [Pseudomonadota bacterium]|nr:peptide deformylase [Pseudomonadota bacterium]MEC7938861.1 peptide deformylase [Pseudomonadota bacterium]MEC8212312.1 peptide deformylase [Pseudomonadota bacterium]